MPLVNDTVRLKAKFYDFNGQPLNLNNPQIIIYNKEKEIVDEITNLENPDSGVYQYDYTIPEAEGYLSVEFRGEFTDGKTTSIKKRMERKWEEVDI